MERYRMGFLIAICGDWKSEALNMISRVGGVCPFSPHFRFLCASALRM